MNRECFEREMLYRLREQRRLHPAIEQEDTVKFVFQALLGPGHLLAAREKVTDFIAHEMDGLPEDPEEPLFETLSPEWCRFNLRRAKTEGIPPSVIAGLMTVSQTQRPFTRKDVFDVCSRLAETGEAAIPDPDSLRRIPDENWLPSHSAAYRTQEQPAYRVVSTDWIPCREVLCRMAEIRKRVKRPLVTIDGPCASGKTTLADRLATAFEAAVIHTDDFVIPHARKTAERLAVPGGNCDADRLVKEVAAPWKRGDQVRYRKYDCCQDQLLPEEQLPDCGMLILEGSYSNLPSIRTYADLRLYTETPEAVRLDRLQKRESPESMRQFLTKWIPLENAYFTAYGIPDQRCVLIRTMPESGADMKSICRGEKNGVY